MVKATKQSFYDLSFLSSNVGFSIQVRGMVMPERRNDSMPLEGSGRPGAPVYIRFVNHRLTLKGDDPDFIDKFDKLMDDKTFSLSPEAGALVWADPSDDNWIKTGLYKIKESTTEKLIPTEKAMDMAALGKQTLKAKDIFVASGFVDAEKRKTTSGAIIDPEVSR